MALGPLIDAAGVRRSLLLSASLTALSRAALALVTHRGLAIFILLVPVSLGGALGSPVLTIAVKRAAPERARGFCFALFYSAMNAAAFVAGNLRDVFVVGVPALGLRPAGLRAYVALGGLVAAVEVVVILCAVHGRPPPSAGEGEVVDVGHGHGPAASAFAPVAVAPVAPPPVPPSNDGGRATPVPPLDPPARRLSSMDGIGLLLDSPPPAGPRPRALSPRLSSLYTAIHSRLAPVCSGELAKFVIVSIACINLKSIFRHIDSTLPKAIVRTFGCCECPKGERGWWCSLSLSLSQPALSFTFLSLLSPHQPRRRGKSIPSTPF